MGRALATFATQCSAWRPMAAEWYDAVLKSAFAELHGRKFNVGEIMASPLQEVSCKIRPLTQSEIEVNGRKFAKRMFSAIDFSLISYDEDLMREQITSSNEAMSGDEVDRVVLYAVGHEMERFCESILFLLNLAHCGVLATEGTRVSVGTMIVSQGSYHLQPVDCSADSYSFLSNDPKISVSFDQALEWSKSCGGFWEGRATKNVEKALMFFSHALERGGGALPIHEIVWVTAALEALACDGSNSISSQLRRRLPQLCSRIEFKDASSFIREAYDFRSRLFHGDIGVDSRFNPDDVSWSPQRYDARSEHFALGLRLLLTAAFWECIANGGYEIIYKEEPIFQ